MFPYFRVRCHEQTLAGTMSVANALQEDRPYLLQTNEVPVDTDGKVLHLGLAKGDGVYHKCGECRRFCDAHISPGSRDI